MPLFTLTEAKPYHCGQMIRLLRKEQRNAMIALGVDQHRQLRTCFDGSAWRKAWLIDGKLAGLGGVLGTQLSSGGYIWLAFSDEATKHPQVMVKLVRRELAEIMQVKRMLVTTVYGEDKTSARFAEFMGFTEDGLDPDPEQRRYVLSQAMLDDRAAQTPVLREGAAFHPFMVYTAGRSRTAWLSAFLSYGQARCGNEAAIRFRGMTEVAAYFARRGHGSAETAGAPGWQLVNHFVPDMRSVVVRRAVDDIVASFARSEVASIARIDEDKLRRVIAYEVRCMEKLSQQPGVLTVDFDDLDRRDVVRAVFEHCLPYRFDEDWWQHMRVRNIQSSVADLFRYYRDNRDHVENFKRDCKRQLIALARSGALRTAEYA